MEETINKKSETEIEVVTVIPEQVIPEKIITQVFSLTDLKYKLSELNNKRNLFVSFRDTPLAELAKIDNDIATIDSEISSINEKIASAESLGIKELSVVSEVVKIN